MADSAFASIEVKGVKDNSFAMDFNPDTKAFHGESYVFNSFNSFNS
jgi:hypothetical protein